MGRPKEPIAVVVAKGKKHLSKAEIAERMATEIKPITDNIIAPGYLTAKQKNEFYKIAGQLEKLKILGETDVDTLARYITANDLYINAVKQLRKKEVRDDPTAVTTWSKIQERYFKQSRACANDLGLSISSRCKLVIPDTGNNDKKEKGNKFAKFEKKVDAV